MEHAVWTMNQTPSAKESHNDWKTNRAMNHKQGLQTGNGDPEKNIKKHRRFGDLEKSGMENLPPPILPRVLLFSHRPANGWANERWQIKGAASQWENDPQHLLSWFIKPSNTPSLIEIFGNHWLAVLKTRKPMLTVWSQEICNGIWCRHF